MKPQNVFIPPYCPRESCKFSLGSEKASSGEKFWTPNGSFVLKSGKTRRRFRCKHCRLGFTCSAFTLNYRYQRRGHINARVFSGVIRGRSNRSIARELVCSESLVRRRLLRLFRVGLLKHAEYFDRTTIREAIAYDGIENFARSQYEPNNVNQAIGVDSLFVYDFNFCPLNRKGKTSENQKNKLFCLERDEGRFDPKAIRSSTHSLIARLIAKCRNENFKLQFISDQHYQYRRAIKWDLSPEEQQWISHETVSSKATRNFQNLLFSVNHMDFLMRDRSSAFKRETISFSKKASRMIQRYALFAFYKNYMRPRFLKPHKRRPNAHTHSPAMHLGLCTKLLQFHEFFNPKSLKFSSKNLNSDWSIFYSDKVPYPRQHCFIKRPS